MVAEGVDTSDSEIEVADGMFFSFEVDASVTPKQCPDYVDPYLIWNIEGGGGVRDGVDINGDYGAYVDALEAECAQLIANAPIPTNYRTISFDGDLADFATQDIIAGDYISFGFTFLDNPSKEVGWQCENQNNCPVSEVLRFYPGNAGTAIYIYQIDQGLPTDHTFTMQFALVDDMTEIPLAVTEGVSVPFKEVDGTPTCELDDYDMDNTNSGSYFVDDFDDVYIPEGDSESASMLTAVLEVTIISAIAVIGALFFGGII